MRYTTEYTIWRGIKKRCHSPNDPAYKWYGGRGISMYPLWRESFAEFFKFLGYRPSEEHSVDRWPDNNGNYEPGNVRWATDKEQHRNTRANVMLEFNGYSMTAGDWADHLGIPRSRVYNRISRRWTGDRIISVEDGRKSPRKRSPITPEARSNISKAQANRWAKFRDKQSNRSVHIS